MDHLIRHHHHLQDLAQGPWLTLTICQLADPPLPQHHQEGGGAPQPRIPTGGFHLPDLTSLMDTVAYEMWKNTIGFFHLSGHTDELIMPIAYQSIKGDVALDIVTHGPHMNLHELIARLNNNFGVMSDKDTLMKELYTIKQGIKGICEALRYPQSATR